MRLLENSTTRSIFNIINEELRNGKEVIVVKTGLSASDKKAKEILNSVIGQMSDGIWENSPGYSRYWKNIDIGEEDGEIVIYGGISYGSPFIDYRSSTGVKDDSAVRKFMAHKIKQIVKIEADDGNSDIVWKRDCETPLSYMGYDETITVRDCYRVYDKLLGRIDRITEGSIPNMRDENFADYVLRDFRLFLMDRYDDELYRDVTEDDVNDYFTGMFFEIMDYDDLDSANAAEDIIRAEYHISDNTDDYQEYDDGDTDWAAEEEADALERFENRYMGGGNGANFNESEDSERILAKLVKDLPDIVEYKGKTYQAFNVMSNDTTGATSKVYYCNMENTPNGDPQESNDYFFVVATLKKTDRGYKGVDHINYVEDLTEGVSNRKHIAESASDRYQVREFDGPGAKFGVYDTKQKKFIQKGSKKVMIAGCDELNKKASNKYKVRESVEEHDLSKDLFGNEAANRMSQKEKDLERDLQYVRDIMAGKTVIDDKYHEELSLDTAKAWLRKDFVYVNSLSAYSPDEINKRLADEYPDIFSVNESAKLNEDSKIWSNTNTEDYYSNLSREEMIQEIKDNGWDEEEINGKPILDADDDELREFLTPYDIDLDYEDYENSILPMIENQCYGDYIVLTGIAANWRGKGEACKAIKLSELKDYLMPSYDSHTVLYCDNQDNLYYTEATHDTPMGGTQMYLYGFYDETAYNNAEKELQKLFDDEDFDMYYFCDYLGYKETEALIKLGLLNPIKRDPHYVGRVDEGHKLMIGNHKELKESKKPKKEKKPEERVIMKQGNVTCLKKDNKFKVFEDADTNLVEYDNQEEAMRDALSRCGVNPDNELKEDKDNLKESTQYQVVKTLNVGPSNYQSEVHGTYDSYEQAEDVCNELNAKGIGATIKEVNETDEALKKLLLKKEELYNDDTISDEDYYSQIEIIDNIIVNNYSVRDIEEAEKELGINS